MPKNRNEIKLMTIFILYLVVIGSELLTSNIGGETGAMYWVGFHFGINPLFCVYVIIRTIDKLSQNPKIEGKFIYLVLLILPICYVFLVCRYPAEWFEFFNLDFKE
jgi:hypothetical protein